MKKIISVLLLLTLVLGLFAGCDLTGTQPTTAPKGNGLDAAAEYLYAMYKNGSELTSSDYTVVGVVRIEDVSYTVTWTTDCEQIVVTPGADKMVTIDLPGDNTEEIAYKLIGTVADAEGNTKSVEFGRKVPAGILTEEQIVDLAYSLADGDVLTGPYKLSGTITSIDSAWSDQYKNITVTIQVGDKADKPIQCYRLAGEGAATLAVGDQIIVEGALKNYKGTIEFDAGCKLLGVVKTIDQTAILEAAYALAPGAAMETNAVLKGVISSIDTEWSDQYQNITVTIICDGKTEYPIKCYRLKGEGAANLAVGNEIVVTGKIKNYQHSSGDCEVEFDAGCQLVALEDYADLYEQLHGAGATEPEKPAVDIITEFTAPFANGNQIVIVATNFNKAFSSLPVKEGSYYQKGADVTVADGTVTGHTDTEVWVVIANDDGTFSFAQGGQNIGMQDQYSSMGLGHPNDKWELIGLSNGSFLLKNVARGNYMQWADSYGNYSTYGSDAPNGDQTFYLSFFVVG